MSKKKYRKGQRIWTLEELEHQEFIFFHDKVYHKGFWQSWQYRWVLERLKRGEFFKADSTEQVVFVCYEENRHLIATENGAVSDLCIKKNFSDAIGWLHDRLKKAKQSGFVVDSEASELEDGVIKDEYVMTEMEENWIVSITMFSGHQENWDESYDIVIEVMEVQ